MASTVRAQGWFLASILTATFFGQFDFFVVNVAAPDIERDLGASNTELELVVAGYAFTYAAGLITGGRLGDLLGRRRVFTAGLVAFAASSALCGLALNSTSLIAFRAIQGLSAAVLLPQVLAFINTAVPRERRAGAMGWFGVASGIGSISGQGIGGLLVQSNLWGLGWRLAFLINLPVVTLAIIVALRVIPRLPVNEKARLDVGGAVALFIGMGGLMSGTLFAQRGQIAGAITSVVLGLIIIAVTVRLQAQRVAAGKPVTMDPALFTVNSMRWGAIASSAFLAYFASFMFILTVVLQGYGQLGPATAGLVFVPSGITFMVSSLATSRWISGHLKPGLLLGCTVTAIGLALALFAGLTHASPNALPWWLVAAVTLTGLGNGMVLPTLIGLSLSQVQPAQAGMASGVITTLQQFAAALGVAVVGALFYAFLKNSTPVALTATSTAHLLLMGCVALASIRATKP